MKNEDNISDTIYLNIIDTFLGKKWERKLPKRQETTIVVGTLSKARGQRKTLREDGELQPTILTHMTKKRKNKKKVENLGVQSSNGLRCLLRTLGLTRKTPHRQPSTF